MMSASQAALRLDRLLDDLVARDIVPGGVAVIAREGRILHERAFGARALTPEREPATLDTLWDCASVTKALVTATLLLQLRAAGDVDFEQPISDLVPEMGEGGASAPRIPSIGELLLHAGGLPAWKPLYAVAGSGLAARAEWLAGHRAAPGREATYGCPGYQLLGLAIERRMGRSFADAARRLWPGRDDLMLMPPASVSERCAPTEEGNPFEKRLASAEAHAEAAAYSGWRDDLIRGAVHDHNAFTAGGSAGNAGLFATGRGLAWMAGRFLVPGDLLEADALDELSRDLTDALPGERRTWGFQRATSEGSSAGAALSARSFGHVGFTGTSAWIDPDRRAVHVLLTNRVHPRWREHAFNADRRAFHEAATALVEASP